MDLGTFGGVKRLGYVLVTVTVMLAAPAALAQSTPLQSQTPDGRAVTLNARESGGLYCLSVAVGGETPRRTAPCAGPPPNAAADARALHVVYRARPEKVAVIHGILSPATAEMRITLADGREKIVRPNGSARAYLHVVRGRPRIATVRAFDRRGNLRGAADFDPRGVRKVRGPFTLFSTRDERNGRALVTAFTANLYREGSTRRSRHACMAITARRDLPAPGIEPGYSGGFACTPSRRRVIVRYAAGCATKRVLLYGLAPRAVRRMTLITAAGARLPVTMGTFPRRLRSPGRAFVVSRPDPGRLSRLEAYGPKGVRLASVPLSGTGSGCGSSNRS